MFGFHSGKKRIMKEDVDSDTETVFVPRYVVNLLFLAPPYSNLKIQSHHWQSKEAKVGLSYEREHSEVLQ
jgi:hypothetical protein